MEGRQVTRVPGLPETRGAQVEVGADLSADHPQVVPEVDDRRSPPEPVAVVDTVDYEPGLEHQRVRDHRVVLGVGVLLDVEVLLDDPLRVGEEWPLRSDRRPELLGRVMRVGGDRGQPGIGHGDLGIDVGELEVLLMLLRTVVAAREREDQRIVALQLAQPPRGPLMVGQLVIRERAAGCDVGAHLSTSKVRVGIRVALTAPLRAPGDPGACPGAPRVDAVTPVAPRRASDGAIRSLTPGLRACYGSSPNQAPQSCLALSVFSLVRNCRRRACICSGLPLATSLRGKCIANGRRKSVVAALTMGKYPGGMARSSSTTHTVVPGTLHGCRVSPSFCVTLAKPTHRSVSIPNGAYLCCTAGR